jgi:hypothetical protein
MNHLRYVNTLGVCEGDVNDAGEKCGNWSIKNGCVTLLSANFDDDVCTSWMEYHDDGMIATLGKLYGELYTVERFDSFGVVDEVQTGTDEEVGVIEITSMFDEVNG